MLPARNAVSVHGPCNRKKGSHRPDASWRTRIGVVSRSVATRTKLAAGMFAASVPSCFAVLLTLRQASKDCWSQNTDCYNNGGATGSKHCPIWEAKCRGIQDACNAKNFHGPPNQGKNLTPPLPYPSSLPPPEPVLDRTAKQAKWVQSSPTTITVSASPSSSLAPVSIVAVPPSNGGSTDQCGPSNGDLKCASGLCCSSHG